MSLVVCTHHTFSAAGCLPHSETLEIAVSAPVASTACTNSVFDLAVCSHFCSDVAADGQSGITQGTAADLSNTTLPISQKMWRWPS